MPLLELAKLRVSPFGDARQQVMGMDVIESRPEIAHLLDQPDSQIIAAPVIGTTTRGKKFGADLHHLACLLHQLGDAGPGHGSNAERFRRVIGSHRHAYAASGL